MFAVITRNRLRRRRHALSMVFAWRQVRRQLGGTPGMLGYTTGIANLREFYTLTLWRKELDMTLFMASDAHREMMWNFRAWTESFWSMRWNADGEALGQWPGPASVQEAGTPLSAAAGPTALQEPPPALRPYIERITARPQPALRDACALIARIDTAAPRALASLRQLLRAGGPPALRETCAVGPGETLVFRAWWNRDEPQRGALGRRIVERFPYTGWVLPCRATDFEIGHWNGLRFRELGEAAAQDHRVN